MATPSRKTGQIGAVRASHYASRFLLKRWERHPGELHYFDVKTSLIRKGSARNGYCCKPTIACDNAGAWQSRVGFSLP